MEIHIQQRETAGDAINALADVITMLAWVQDNVPHATAQERLYYTAR